MWLPTHTLIKIILYRRQEFSTVNEKSGSTGWGLKYSCGQYTVSIQFQFNFYCRTEITVQFLLQNCNLISKEKMYI